MVPFKSAISCLLLIALFSCYQKTSTEPTLENRIFDNANILTQDEEKTIFQLIQVLEHEVGSQMAVVTIDTLNGISINAFSLKHAEDLHLGRAEFSDGVLLTVAVKNREIRIEVGSGLEEIIKDEIAARIIREDIAPQFKDGKYGQGIFNGIYEIKTLVESKKELIGK